MNSRFDISEKNWKQKDVNKNLDLLNQSDRKITRNQKRRHDEINHVPMVKRLFTILLYDPIKLQEFVIM